MKEFLKKYWMWFVIGLLTLMFFFKSCQSMSRKQDMLFYKITNEQTIDSLNHVIATQKDSINILYNDNALLQSQLQQYGTEITSLKEDKQHLKEINKIIISKDK